MSQDSAFSLDDISLLMDDLPELEDSGMEDSGIDDDSMDEMMMMMVERVEEEQEQDERIVNDGQEAGPVSIVFKFYIIKVLTNQIQE